jgi:hypothetical protein
MSNDVQNIFSFSDLNILNNSALDKSKVMAMQLYRQFVFDGSNKSKKLKLDSLSKEQQKLFAELLNELNEINLLNQLLSMKIYYQINVDPRNADNKALYAKAVLPKYKNHTKRKHIGIHFGTLKNKPEGWTNANMKTAKLELVEKAFRLLSKE